MNGMNPYDDGPEEMSGDQKMNADSENEQDAGDTALLPESFFQGKELNPGSRCEVEIVKVHGTQVAVKYVPHDEDKEKEDGEMSQQPDQAEPAAADQGQMSSMYE